MNLSTNVNLIGNALNSNNVSVKVEFKVTNVSPNIGSMYGGTLVTITGSGFPEGTTQVVSVALDSPNPIDPTRWCYVESITTTQIKCRIQFDN